MVFHDEKFENQSYLFSIQICSTFNIPWPLGIKMLNKIGNLIKFMSENVLTTH